MRHGHRSACTPSSRWTAVGLIVGATLAAFGCSVATRDRIKHLLFEYPEEPSSPAPSGVEPVHPPDPFADQWQARPHFLSRHEPFVTRQCQTCHQSEAGQKPRADWLDACRDCHAPLFSDRRYVHGPFASFDCLACHNMHVSRQVALLIAPQPLLCTSCHAAEYTDTARTTYHKDIEGDRCTVCHDPHYADHPRLLKPERVPTSARLVPQTLHGEPFGALTHLWPVQRK